MFDRHPFTKGATLSIKMFPRLLVQERPKLFTKIVVKETWPLFGPFKTAKDLQS